MQTLPTADAAAAAGISYKELASWIDRRVIDPTVQGQPGIPHQFARNAVILLSIAAVLHHCGIPPRSAVRHAELFFTEFDGMLSPWARTWLVVNPDGARVLRTPYGQRPEDIMEIGPATLQADLDAIVETACSHFKDAA